jgi:hypothetical protein
MRWRLQPAPAPTLLLVLLVATVAAVVVVVRAEPQVPCYFVFGDSLVDNGNNNDIASLARANYPPYGIDFAAGPTGRFSNGLTTVDAICKPIVLHIYIDRAGFFFVYLSQLHQYSSMHTLSFLLPYKASRIIKLDEMGRS